MYKMLDFDMKIRHCGYFKYELKKMLMQQNVS